MSETVITESNVLDALRSVMDPDLRRDIVSLNFVRNMKIEGGTVSFDVNLTTPACPVKDRLREQSRQAVLEHVPGVKDVRVNMTAEVRRPPAPETSRIRGVKNIVAVGSGKGGVGKSTVAANVAVSLARSGAKVGLLDADIYGPSIPIMMRSQEEPEIREQVIQPVDAHGVKLMSMGYLSGEMPLIWRGPMAHKALQQSLLGVNWGDLDYLVVDLPPGTGDVHLTLVQTVPVTGAVIVSTPQDVGLQISMKTLRMFQQTKVPLLGVIENMSYYICPHCGGRDEIFGHGGAARAAESLGVPFLGEIPLDPAIRKHSDTGTPVVLAQPESASGRAFAEVTGKLAQQVSIQAFRSVPLTIVEE
ncbi:MAG: Mrp/NBP35 family ATP-binding protein [Candidatus Eisenbacteria bacterium]|uniref:Iron-sulfur cluster carrier protein n=1 Tax=Eiseniibacteriota bacterium TaxID=2212470 RepID=A0A538T4M1_UNCEI|nr:MAG: Mrp/NBP35 family ATP-binding protein [Candidatus Eisenbacteria bacterium]